MSATAGTQAAGPPPGQDPATNQRTVAQILDEAAAEQKKKDDDKELYDPSRKLVFKPNITPDQREWIDRRAYFVQQLKKEAVLTVMDKNFEEAQKLYLNPPLTNGEILRIQNEHAVDYKAVLGRGGKFHRVPDNLATKMAMLHFGLHVAPLTLNNVLNCSNDGDASDPEDDPEDLPRIQRILYAEKPLEFLDEYSQRSHGYPILRTKGKTPEYLPTPPTLPASNRPVPAATTVARPTQAAHHPHHHHHHHHHHGHHHGPFNRPINPGPPTVGMRGGAGNPSDLNSPATERWLYGPNQTKYLVTNDCPNAFLEAASQLLEFDKTGQFEFHIDLYQNSATKSKAKPHIRTIDIDEMDYVKQYKELVAKPLFNYINDWVLVVQPSRELNTGEKPPATFTTAGTVAKPERQIATNTNTPQAGPNSRQSRTSNSGNNAPLPSPQGLSSSAPAGDSSGQASSTEQANPAGPSTQPTSIPVAHKTGTIYGYAGRLDIRSDRIPTTDHFLQLSLRLLGRPKNDPKWGESPYRVTVLSSSGDSVENALDVGCQGTLRAAFDYIRPILQTREPWNIFIGPKGFTEPGSQAELVPPHNSQDIFELTLKDVGTAYWKVPGDRTDHEKPAINQLQPGFFHAMRFLFDGEYPLGEVKVSGKSIGHGGFELTSNLQDIYSSPATKYAVTYKEVVKFTAYPRLIGSNKTFSAGGDDFKGVLDQIINAFSKRTTAGSPPHFTIWGHPEEREKRLVFHGNHVSLASTSSSTRTLQRIFPKPRGLKTAPFRAQWGTFNIKSADNKSKTVTWQPLIRHETLESFKARLKLLFGDNFSESTPFIVTEADIEATEQRRFFVNSDTTDEQWRRDVFDWFSTPNLEVRVGVDIPYNLDKRNPWGHFYNKPAHEPVAPVGGTAPSNPNAPTNPQGPQQPGVQPSQTQPAQGNPPPPPPHPHPHHHPHLHPQQPTTTGFGTTVFANRGFNKARYLSEKAGQAPASSYPEWSSEQRYQDNLHYSSYLKDQGVMVPGKTPAAPMYGESIQVPQRISDALPTIYLNHLTPTDIRRLQEERQLYRNDALQREHFCRICPLTFKDYETDKIEAHYKTHKDRELDNGQCILCNTNSWAFMSIGERKAHIQKHVDERTAWDMEEFWGSHRCPACDETFRDMHPDDIIAHCINDHAPGVLHFCDNCGINESVLSNTHQAYHQSHCRNVPCEPVGSKEPEFCIRCGKNTENQDPTEEKLHNRDCHFTGNSFCRKCGLEMTGFSPEAATAHYAVCRRPGGRRRKFCRKCGIQLEGLGNAEIKNHSASCLKKPDIVPDNRSSTLAEIRREKDILAQLKARTASIQDLERQRGQRRDTPLLGSCPFDGCNEPVEYMDKSQLYSHFKKHINENSSGPSMSNVSANEILCPLHKHDGTVCNRILDTSRFSDFGVHLVHGLTPEEQQNSDREAAALQAQTNRQVRALTRSLKNSVQEAKNNLLTSLPSSQPTCTQPTNVQNSGLQTSPTRVVSSTVPQASKDSVLAALQNPFNQTSIKDLSQTGTPAASEGAKPTASDEKDASAPSKSPRKCPPPAASNSRQKRPPRPRKLTEEEKLAKMSNPNEQADQAIHEQTDDVGGIDGERSSRRRKGGRNNPHSHPQQSTETESLYGSTDDASSLEEELPALKNAPYPVTSRKRNPPKGTTEPATKRPRPEDHPPATRRLTRQNSTPLSQNNMPPTASPKKPGRPPKT